MRFSCGETWEHKKARLSGWHKKFIIFPRTIKVVDGKKECAWLETVERKGEIRHIGDGLLWEWGYRELNCG